MLAMRLVSEKIRREKVGVVIQFLLFYCSREQIRLVENGLLSQLAFEQWTYYLITKILISTSLDRNFITA
jgi:hypothetical protein